MQQLRRRYTALFHQIIRWILQSFLRDAVSRNITYIVISKNVAFRDALAHFVIRNYPNQAFYVDKVCGVEYAWVYKVNDLLTAASGPSENYAPVLSHKP